MTKKVVGIILVIFGLVCIAIALRPKTTPVVNKSAQPTPVAKQVLLDIKKDKLTNDTTKFTFTQGDTIEITVTTDIDGEVHFHGYDKQLTAKKGQKVKLEFVLDTAGNFPFELEDTSTDLGTLIVKPK